MSVAEVAVAVVADSVQFPLPGHPPRLECGGSAAKFGAVTSAADWHPAAATAEQTRIPMLFLRLCIIVLSVRGMTGAGPKGFKGRRASTNQCATVCTLAQKLRLRTSTVVQPFHRPLLLLTSCEELEANIRRVIERPFALQRVADWPALRSALKSASPTTVCFVDAISTVEGDKALAEGLREIAREFPLMAVVACLEVCPDDGPVLRTLQDWGVAELLDLNRERYPAAVERRLQDVEGVWAQRLLERALPRSLSARGRILLEKVAQIAAEGGHVPELADSLGIYKRTVPRWCAAAGVPEARRMFTWLRLLLAAVLLDDPERSFENVARTTGYSSAASLKSTTKAFTGMTPTELRARGAFDAIAELARAEFREAREAARQSRRQENSWFN